MTFISILINDLLKDSNDFLRDSNDFLRESNAFLKDSSSNDSLRGKKEKPHLFLRFFFRETCVSLEKVSCPDVRIQKSKEKNIKSVREKGFRRLEPNLYREKALKSFRKKRYHVRIMRAQIPA